MASQFKNSIYPKMEMALDMVEAFMVGGPKLSFIFETNASGGVDKWPEKNSDAHSLVNTLDTGFGGLSPDAFNEALPEIENRAVEMGREVTRAKRDGKYYTTISPILSNDGPA